MKELFDGLGTEIVKMIIAFLAGGGAGYVLRVAQTKKQRAGDNSVQAQGNHNQVNNSHNSQTAGDHSVQTQSNTIIDKQYVQAAFSEPDLTLEKKDVQARIKGIAVYFQLTFKNDGEGRAKNPYPLETEYNPAGGLTVLYKDKNFGFRYYEAENEKTHEVVKPNGSYVLNVCANIIEPGRDGKTLRSVKTNSFTITIQYSDEANKQFTKSYTILYLIQNNHAEVERVSLA